MIFNNAEELREYLCESTPANLIHICENMVSLFTDCGTEDGPLLLRIFLQDITLPELAGEEMTEEFLRISSGQTINLQEFLVLENRVVSNLTQARVSTEVFYRSLWEKLNDHILISGDHGRAAFLFSLRIDNRIPYFELDEGCVMDEQRYKELVEKLQPAIAKGSFVLNTNLNYKTQKASLLMDIAKSLDDDEEQTVFWAVLLGRIQTIQRLQRQVVQIKEEAEQPASQSKE